MQVKHYHFKKLASTNDYAKEQLFSFDKQSLTVISAAEQTRGRGQFNRKWISPKGMNLYASFCFFISEEKQEAISWIHTLATAACEILNKRGINAEIKKPNDLFVNGKKIAGILCETTQMPPYLGVVIGIGLNVNMPLDLLQHIDQPATSMSVEANQRFEIEEILNDLQAAFVSTHFARSKM